MSQWRERCYGVFVSPVTIKLICLYVECPIFLTDFNQNWSLSNIFLTSLVSNFADIRPVGTALICADRWTNGHDEANRYVRLSTTRTHLARLQHLEKRFSFRHQWQGRGGTQAYCVLSVLKTFCPVTENSVCFGPNLKRRLAILCTRGRKRTHFA
jgi:hypothetical protein